MKALRIMGLLTALALAATLPAAGQSLAEAARKEKERQQAAQKQGKTVKTYTSEDLAKKKAEAGTTAGTAPTAAPAAPSASAPAAPAGSAAETGETPEQVEKKWVEKYKAIKMEIKQKRERIQALQNELNQLTTGLMGAWSPGQSQAIRDTIAARQEEIKKLEAEIRAKEAELDKVMRDARREGVPPGAFRKADRELEAAGAPPKP